MNILKTKYISRSAVKEEIEYTIEVTPEEAEELEKAIKLIENLKEKILPSSITLSEWHSIDIKVDRAFNLVCTSIRHGMIG